MSPKNSLILKMFCYIMIPIVCIILIFSLGYVINKVENPDYYNHDNYFETNSFSSSYYSQLNRCIYRVNSVNDAYKEIYYGDEVIEYQSRYYNENTNFNYLIIDNNSKKAYTNIEITAKTDTIEEIKQKILSNTYYWNYDKTSNTIDTNIENISQENMPYTDYLYEYITQEYNFNIYTSVDTPFTSGDNFYWNEKSYQTLKMFDKIPFIVIIPICIISLAIMCIYLLVAIGHSKNTDKISLNTFDRLPLEIVVSILLMVIGLTAGIMGNFTMNTVYEIIMLVIILLIIYICMALGLNTIIKRIKAKFLIKSTLTYRICKWIKNIMQQIFLNFNISLKVAILYGGFIIISIILCFMGGIGVLLALCFWSYMFYKIIQDINQIRDLELAIKNIYEGNTNIELETDNLKGEIKQTALYIQDIAGGFSNAVEESLKSERLKTELITNVSHDIKTPLTSIINYVDLLKQENIENETAKGYIEILDNKSQRLKRLTEDLIEASKVSSGNVKLNMEKINVSELMKQTIGEFEDKFTKKDLKVIMSIEDEGININGDSKYMFRIIENLFSNISKYAGENSRVYIDINKLDKKQVKISIKNISKERLNISVDELMQRFVRGDKSRTTEGSGLGISISKSLTELQNGHFDMQIDGDLFKVELVFDVL